MGAYDPKIRKRSREGESSMTASALKRSASSSSSNSQPHIAAGVQRTTLEEALSYVTLVRETLHLHHKMERYRQFIELLLEHSRGRIDISGVVIVLKDLFSEHRNLKLGFLKFLPPGYKLALLRNDDRPQLKPYNSTSSSYSDSGLEVPEAKLEFQKPVIINEAIIPEDCTRTERSDLSRRNWAKALLVMPSFPRKPTGSTPFSDSVGIRFVLLPSFLLGCSISERHLHLRRLEERRSVCGGAFLQPQQRDFADRREEEGHLGKKPSGSTDEGHLCWASEEQADMASKEAGGFAEGVRNWAWQKAGT
ncbi:Paired amphipathic helix protein Sin3-like 6 [Nymphaea thermarum]|nr:Paired amphipathic helix protein Sin3-like 6 [Nymphaea thermarum]